MGDKQARITDSTASDALPAPTKVVSIASSEERVSPDASGSPKINASIKTLCEGSGGQVESLKNKTLEQVSGNLNEGTKEDVANRDATAIDGREVQNGVMESVRPPSASEVDLVQSAVRTEKYEITTDDKLKPRTTVLEVKGSESLQKATANHVDVINSNRTGMSDYSPANHYVCANTY